MCALDLRRVPLTRMVLVGIEMPCVRALIIGVIAPDAQRLEQRFELQKHLLLPPAKDLHQHLARLVSARIPQPALRVLLPHIGPHCIEERFGHRAERRLLFFNVLRTVVGLLFNTRAVARIPLPLRLLSTICSLIAGVRPV